MSRLTRRAEADGVKAVWYGNREVFLEGETGYAEAEKLAHYEDLEEQCRLIELPCKIGDTVWCIDSFNIDGTLRKHPILREIKFNHHHLEFVDNTVFLTKAEAERKLAELQSFPTLPILHGNVAPASREDAMERLGLRDKLAEVKGGE